MDNYSFLSLFDSQQISLVITDKKGIIKKFNKSFTDWYGKILEDIENIIELDPKIISLFVDSSISDIKLNFTENREISIEKKSLNDDFIFFFKEKKSAKFDYIYMKVINTINESVVVVDCKGTIILFNTASEKFENILRENALGRNVLDFYKLEKEESLFMSVLETGLPLPNQRQIYKTPDGKRIDVMVDTYPLYEDNELLGAVSIMKDYTKIEELSKVIVDLQDQLIKKNKNNHAGNVKSNVSPLPAKYKFKDIICISDNMNERISISKRAAQSISPILIYGETGTGKELFAQSIHNYSNNSKGPFIAINCAAIPDNLLEGLLFGTVKGAFSDAIDRPGLFEQAENGTILLDELNSMSLSLQSKLLRVIQENKVRRVGGSKEILLNTRLITIMNENPLEAIKKNKIRQDLFYRIGVILIEVPPLRDRMEDIPLLSQMFIHKYNKILNKQISRLSFETSEVLNAYKWPGNVRELQHIVEYSMNILNKGERIIEVKHLPAHIRKDISKTTEAMDTKLTLEEQLNTEEIKILKKTLEANAWNISETARKLDIKRQSLQYRIRKYSLK
jgi:arginine utilization regulatory protein